MWCCQTTRTTPPEHPPHTYLGSGLVSNLDNVILTVHAKGSEKVASDDDARPGNEGVEAVCSKEMCAYSC